MIRSLLLLGALLMTTNAFAQAEPEGAYGNVNAHQTELLMLLVKPLFKGKFPKGGF